MLDELELAYDDDETDMRGGRHRRHRSRRGRSLFTGLMVIVLLAVVGGVGFLGVTTVKGWLAVADFSGPGHGTVQVQVQRGETSSDIANTLYTKKVVKSAKAFVDAANDNPDGLNVQPGFYELKLEMKASLALALLLDPKSKVSTKVIIPEGWTANRIFARLSTLLKLPVSDFTKAAKDPSALGISNDWFVRDDKKRANKTVEGFLYPSTYEFDPGTSAKDALSQMVQEFMAKAATAGLDKVPGMSPFEALIVASLVQGEAIPKDMPKVARVVYNRLDDKEQPWLNKLQFDSTTNYWLDLKGNGAKESRDLTNAELNDPKDTYSTTKYAGLPPGPIDCPDLTAMQAAAHPAPGNWEFFVRIDKDGNSAFTKDYAVQQQNEEKARKNGAG